MRIRPSSRVVVLAVALPFLVAALPHATRHLALSKSLPAEDAVTTPPPEIRLWFTQQPQDGATSIRLVGADEQVRPVGEVAALAGESSAFAAKVTQPLAAGRYTVAWRTMAADGHVVRGEFDFTVQTP